MGDLEKKKAERRDNTSIKGLAKCCQSKVHLPNTSGIQGSSDENEFCSRVIQVALTDVRLSPTRSND